MYAHSEVDVESWSPNTSASARETGFLCTIDINGDEEEEEDVDDDDCIKMYIVH